MSAPENGSALRSRALAPGCGGLRGLSLALLTTLHAAVWASSERVSGLVTYVADGDTVYVRMQERQEQQAVRCWLAAVSLRLKPFRTKQSMTR